LVRNAGYYTRSQRFRVQPDCRQIATLEQATKATVRWWTQQQARDPRLCAALLAICKRASIPLNGGGSPTTIGLPHRVKGIDMTKPAPPSPDRPGRAVLQGLLDVRPSLGVEHERAAVAAADAVAQGLAVAKVYAFASVDYPGAAQSLVFDSDTTTAVGAFIFDPGSTTSPTTAFTFTGGVYQILTVPSSTASIATAINAAGLIVGVYQDLSGVLRGFANNAGTFSNVDFPGADGTQAIGVNDAGQIVGAYFDVANTEHGFLSSGGTFTPIDFPGATGTAAAGINATGDIVGVWSDATGSHGFCSRPACSPRSTFHLPPAPAPSASPTPGRSPASMTTPPAPPTALSTPAGPSAPWTSPAPAAPS
jgi:hypothetical protein